ncbi:hypothetical protein ACFQ7F_07735 [Streptomyces sp. NPDC056486]|uniref:hypothetical protein n=1 Tax=Streptomyces sp. NPDC056486 TaxID=3345835 RepID=UPI00368216A7
MALLAAILMTASPSQAAAQIPAQAAAAQQLTTFAAQDGEVGLVTPKRSAAAAPTTCNWTGASVKGSPTYAVEAPRALTALAWTGTVNASCTGEPVSISTRIEVTDPQGIPHPIASGASVPVNSGYVCSHQGSSNCAGSWTAKFTLTFSAKPGSKWPGGGGCTPSGAIQTCTFGGPVGNIPAAKVPEHTVCKNSANVALLADVPCYNLPPSGDTPLMSLRSIKSIRDFHFEGGAQADATKGLFYSHLTNNDLQKVWEAGMTSSGSWKLNSTGYYEKTFTYTGAGIQSPRYGGGAPATKVTIVAEQYGAAGYSEVVTMYPATG